MRIVFLSEGGAFFPAESLVIMKLSGIVPAGSSNPTDSYASVLCGILPSKRGSLSPLAVTQKFVFERLFTTKVPVPVAGS